MSTLLTKEAILQSKDYQDEVINVPEWGGSVRLKTMSGVERDMFETEAMKRKKGDKIELKGLKSFLLMLTLVNDKGERLFAEADIDELNKKSGAVIDTLFVKCQDLNKLTQGSLEDSVKN